MRLPKPTSFPTQCCVWASVMNQSKHRKVRLKCFLGKHFKDLDRIDGEPMEFAWKIFPEFTTLRILDEIQKMMTKSKCEPEQFKGRLIFMSVYNGIHWGKRGNKENCITNIELILRTIIFVNQLSIYGAVTDLCK